MKGGSAQIWGRTSAETYQDIYKLHSKVLCESRKRVRILSQQENQNAGKHTAHAILEDFIWVITLPPNGIYYTAGYGCARCV
jgi:hypothetical protein